MMPAFSSAFQCKKKRGVWKNQSPAIREQMIYGIILRKLKKRSTGYLTNMFNQIFHEVNAAAFLFFLVEERI